MALSPCYPPSPVLASFRLREPGCFCSLLGFPKSAGPAGEAHGALGGACLPVVWATMASLPLSMSIRGPPLPGAMLGT